MAWCWAGCCRFSSAAALAPHSTMHTLATWAPATGMQRWLAGAPWACYPAGPLNPRPGHALSFFLPWHAAPAQYGVQPCNLGTWQYGFEKTTHQIPPAMQRLRIMEFTLDHEAPYFSNMRRRTSRKVGPACYLAAASVLACWLLPPHQPQGGPACYLAALCRPAAHLCLHAGCCRRTSRFASQVLASQAMPHTPSHATHTFLHRT